MLLQQLVNNDVQNQQHDDVNLSAFARPDDVDDLEIRVDEQNVFWFEVGV